MKKNDSSMKNENIDISKLSNNDLILTDKNLKESIPVLIRSGKYIEARKKQELQKQIKCEIENRKTRHIPSLNNVSSLTHPKLEKFDQETEKSIRIIEERAEKMDKEVFNIWETRLKERYFVPSPYIAELKGKVKRLEDRGDFQTAETLSKEINELEECDRQQMIDAYEKDLNDARKAEMNKNIAEIRKLKKQRTKMRQNLEDELKAKRQ